MNSLLYLGRCLGDVSSPTFQRHYQHQLVQSLDHREIITFSYLKPNTQTDSSDNDASLSKTKKRKLLEPSPLVAHQAGSNCLSIDPQTGRFLITGGADSTIRLWDLESHSTSSSSLLPYDYSPCATLSRINPLAHTHALTSLSIYPFDETPSTLLSTSYDNTLLLTSITPSSLEPLHKISLDFTPYTHAISPHPSSSPLVAVGTSHPAIRLIDLRTGLATHSLPGHNGAIYALTFSPSPRYPHLLISGSADSRILLFDIRRANPAFASLDLDDAIGFPLSSHNPPSESRPPNLHLNYTSSAHAGPVTGLSIPISSPTKLISAGHDSRLRLWDLSTGRNDLIHFGPRIRNTRAGNLTPLILPSTIGKSSRETLLWPNDDSRGEIHMHSLREGTLLKVLRTKGVDRSNTNTTTSTNTSTTTKNTASSSSKKPSSIRLRKGKINALALRHSANSGHGLELYSAHADGSICAWLPDEDVDQDEEVKDDGDRDEESPEGEARRREGGKEGERVMSAEQASKKRKRDLIGDLVQGLSKKNVTFS